MVRTSRTAPGAPIQRNAQSAPSDDVKKRIRKFETRGGAGGLTDLMRSQKERSESALRRAVRADDLEVVEALLDSGVDPNAKSAASNHDGRTALHAAAEPGVPARQMRTLIARGGNPNALRGKEATSYKSIPSETDGWRPLHEAIFHRNLPVVRELVGNPLVLLDAPNSTKERPVDLAREFAGKGYVSPISGTLIPSPRITRVAQASVQILDELEEARADRRHASAPANAGPAGPQPTPTEAPGYYVPSAPLAEVLPPDYTEPS